MNMQDQSDVCEKKFLELAKKKIEDTSTIPSHTITKYCRMLALYCDAEGNVSESFRTSMDTYVKEIIAVEGMEEILNMCRDCPE